MDALLRARASIQDEIERRKTRNIYVVSHIRELRLRLEDRTITREQRRGLKMELEDYLAEEALHRQKIARLESDLVSLDTDIQKLDPHDK